MNEEHKERMQLLAAGLGGVLFVVVMVAGAALYINIIEPRLARRKLRSGK